LNNETLERLRLPAAWVLIGAVGAGVLAGFIRLIANSGYPGNFASALVGAGGHFFGLSVVILLAAAVLLVLTSERTRPAAFGIVLTSLIISGLGLLFAAINLITEFVAASNDNMISLGFAGFLGTLGQGAVLGIFAFALLKAFNDPTLVPRAAPQAQAYGGYPQGGVQPQAYAQGYQDPTMTGGQPAADPAQAVSGQQQAYDPNQYGQAQQYATGAQQSYAQPQYGTDASGQQAAYDPNQYGQQAQQYGTDASGQAQPQAAYDPNQYGQAQAQQQYGTDAQQAYGQAYDPSQYAPQGEQAAASGEQAAQDAVNYGWYGQGQQPAASESGVEPFFNSGENNGTETTDQGGSVYGDQYGSGSGYGSDQQGQGGTGGQQGWYGGEGQR
jgi:hypothetical protein